MTGGILLVAGTSIGAGMLALPITTGAGGFFGALTLFSICFIFMMTTLFLWLEANMTFKEIDTNMITLARHRLGPIGEITAWVMFLMLMYAASAAYLSGMGSLLSKVVSGSTPFHVTDNQGIVAATFIFGLVVYLGASWVDGINRIAMLGLISTYLGMSLFITPFMKLNYFLEGDLKYLPAAVPIVVLAFISHVILPSLRVYCNDNLSDIKKILIWGNVIAFVVYIVWEMLIIGVIPLRGDAGLIHLGSQPHPVSALTYILHKDLGLSWIAITVGAFSFFALLSSFLGVGLALTDFLSDGLSIKKSKLGMLFLVFISFSLPLMFALFYPSGFVIALSYAGIFAAVLYGILPFAMVWKCRKAGIKSRYTLPGGKPVLFIVLFGTFVIIGIQVASRFGMLPLLGG